MRWNRKTAPFTVSLQLHQHYLMCVRTVALWTRNIDFIDCLNIRATVKPQWLWFNSKQTIYNCNGWEYCQEFTADFNSCICTIRFLLKIDNSVLTAIAVRLHSYCQLTCYSSWTSFAKQLCLVGHLLFCDDCIVVQCALSVPYTVNFTFEQSE